MSFQVNEILKKLEWRYATKQFNVNKKISEQHWSLLEQSLILSPSSYGLQPWKFFIIENKNIREKLLPVSWGQKQVTEASHFVVFTSLKEMSVDYIQQYVTSIAQIRGQDPASLEGYKGMMTKNIVEGMDNNKLKNWTQRQAYIAMGFLLETAALLDIDTVAMEGIDPVAYDTILGLNNSSYATVAAVALGYRDEGDKYATNKKVRFSREQIIQKI